MKEMIDHLADTLTRTGVVAEDLSTVCSRWQRGGGTKAHRLVITLTAPWRDKAPRPVMNNTVDGLPVEL
jgi:hypothetical protein